MATPSFPFPPMGVRPDRPRSFGILSTYPPTPCGLANFSSALARGLSTNGTAVRIVRVGDGSTSADGRVIGELINGSASSVAASARLLNECDVAVVQHEYGLYGGADGEEILEILANLEVPSIVIAHTVLSAPTAHQRAVLVAVAELADQVIVMSEAARDRLCRQFEVESNRVTTIWHGAAIPARSSQTTDDGRPTMLTWGLLGPGKGIERVVDAMPSLHDLPEQPRYLVAGQTHPKVLAADGEAYRQARVAQAARNGVSGSVVFDSAYRDLASLAALIQSAAVVVLPYDSRDQATSGVLVDAIAAGRPVVATAFPHAVELLSSGAGLVVDHDDADGMASALRRVLVEPGLADRMAGEASRLAPSLGWPVIAAAYLALGNRLLAEREGLASPALQSPAVA